VRCVASVQFHGLLLEVCTTICLGVKRHLVRGHEISRLQHGLQLIMARYTRIIHCRPCCNLYIQLTVGLGTVEAGVGLPALFNFCRSSNLSLDVLLSTI